MNPLPYEQNSVKMIGRNKSTFDVVSSIITVRQYVILVAPESTAVAPRIDTVELLITKSGLYGNIIK